MEIKILILLCMIMIHIIDDFRLQGILAELKQRQWWKDNYPSKKYRYDYIIALFIHSFSWAFSITIPAILYTLIVSKMSIYILLVSIIINMIIHANIDNMKANKYTINLVTDQMMHIIQISCTWIICIL